MVAAADLTGPAQHQVPELPDGTEEILGSRPRFSRGLR